jgi:hypothetical protein
MNSCIHEDIELDEELSDFLKSEGIELDDQESLYEMLDIDEVEANDIDVEEPDTEETSDRNIQNISCIEAERGKYKIVLARNPCSHIKDEIELLSKLLADRYSVKINDIPVYNFGFGKIRPLEDSVVQQEIVMLADRARQIEDAEEKSAITREIQKLKNLI